MSYHTRIDAQDTEAKHDTWHERLEEARTVEGQAPRRAVLISEILGDEDGPHEEED